MKTFMAIYLAPVDVLDAWMSKPEEERKDDDAKMRADWDAWMAARAGTLKATYALGKTKSVSKDGVADARNGMMLYTLVDAESLDDAAALFEGHPHFGIPGATIEVMEMRQM